MNIFEEISKAFLPDDKIGFPIIVAICGAADLGKTFFSKNLQKFLLRKGISSSHLTMDSFLIDRTIRNAQNISGYNIESYDIVGIKKSLNKFSDGSQFKYKSYDHAAGKASGKLKIINPAQVLLFDGLHSMSNEFETKISYSIFIFTSDYYLVQIRSESDISKRNYTKAYSQSISAKELVRYKNRIEGYKGKANLKLYLEDKWSYRIDP